MIVGVEEKPPSAFDRTLKILWGERGTCQRDENGVEHEEYGKCGGKGGRNEGTKTTRQELLA